MSLSKLCEMDKFCLLVGEIWHSCLIWGCFVDFNQELLKWMEKESMHGVQWIIY